MTPKRLHRPTLAEVESACTRLECLGTGLYACVYLQADGSVLKISGESDGTYQYIEWCLLRAKKYGANSIEMAGLPQVAHYGLREDGRGWWAVMPRYVVAGKGGTKEMVWGDVDRWVDGMRTLLQKLFQIEWCDLHHGNVMWDPVRKQWVITDPFADPTGIPGRLAKQPRRWKHTAAWKRSPLENRMHAPR